MRAIELTLNGTRVRTTVEPHETLLGALRQRLAASAAWRVIYFHIPLIFWAPPVWGT